MAVWSAGSSLDVEGGATLRGPCLRWPVSRGHLQEVILILVSICIKKYQNATHLGCGSYEKEWSRRWNVRGNNDFEGMDNMKTSAFILRSIN